MWVSYSIFKVHAFEIFGILRTKMDLIRACKCGDVDSCRVIRKNLEAFPEVLKGDLSPLHWLMIGQNISDDDCISIIQILDGTWVNDGANDLILAGTSQLERRSAVTPLHLAVLHKSAAVVGQLIRIGGNPDLQDSNGETPLMYACRQGDFEKAAVFIHNGSDVSLVNKDQQSAVLLTTSLSIRELLISRLNAKLVRSLRLGGGIDQIESLLTARADVNCTDTDGSSAMAVAIRAGDYSVVLRILESDSLDVSDSKSLEELITSELSSRRKLEVAHELLFKRIDVNQKTSQGRTPLELCQESGQSDLAKLLIASGATEPTVVASSKPPTSPQPDEPLSPLHLLGSVSASYESTTVFDIGEVAKRIGDLYAELAGARVSVDSLQAAISSRNSPTGSAAPVPVVTEKDLIAQKIELQNKLHMYSVEFDRVKVEKNKDFKAIKDFMELQKLMASTRTEITSINERIANRDFDIVDSEVSPVADHTEPGSWFRSPESVEADIDVCMRQIRKSCGTLSNLNSAIFEVVKRCQSPAIIPALKLLRNRGSDLNYQDPESGQTSLMLASSTGNADLVDWLLHGNVASIISAVDRKNGWNALHYGVRSGNKSVCEAIIGKAGGDKFNLATKLDKQGKTAFDYCINPAIEKLGLLITAPAQSS